MKRFDAIKNIMENITDELIICNIGFPSRELYEIKDRDENFYMLGSMGLASSIGLGLAMAISNNKKVVVFDGDGSLLMNMGSLVTIFNQNPENLVWVVFDNGCYGSTGNQCTYAQNLSLF
ncbi:MAG: thiamine pyrophosphate-dependent enzyme, partial [Methanobacteriaceae archaeon]